MRKTRIIVSLGLALAMAVSVAACADKGVASTSDTAAPVFTESETKAPESETAPIHSGSSDEASGFILEQAITIIKSELGHDKDASKWIFESTLGAKLSSEVAVENNYYYSTDVTIEDVQFTQLVIKTNKSDGTVLEVDLINDTSNTTDCESYMEKYKNKLSSVYGDKLTSSDSSEYEGFKVSVGEGANCIIGGSYSANLNTFYLIISAE